MYTKISHGTNFMGAALYDAEGLSQTQKAQKAGKVELLETSNLLSIDAPGIAQEMQKVASYSRSQKPVWNISMSAPEGVRLTMAQWQQAAAHNLRVMGVDPARHQYAIYRHSDTPRDHIHILFNSVPVDGGPAISRQFKAAKAKLAASEIDQALGITADKGQGIRDEISRRLASALASRPTTADELKSDLVRVDLRVEYATNQKGIYGLTFQLSDRDHEPVKGSAVKIDGKPAKWGTLAVHLEANRAEYEAEINRLRQDADRATEAEKSREIAEKALKKAQQDIQEVYEKRDLINEAFQQSEKAREIAERTLKQLINQRPLVKTVPEIKEVVKPDPKDKERIGQLERENQALTRRLQLSKQLEVIKGVATTPAQRASLLDGQCIRLNGLTGVHGLFDAHVMVSLSEGKVKFERVPAPAAVKPQVIPIPVVPVVPPEPQAAPTQKPLPPEPPTLDSTIVETMRQIIIKAATKSKTWDGFSASLRLAGVKRQKSETGKFSYAYKNVQATATELGFKTGEINALIDLTEQKSLKIKR